MAVMGGQDGPDGRLARGESSEHEDSSSSAVSHVHNHNLQPDASVSSASEASPDNMPAPDTAAGTKEAFLK